MSSQHRPIQATTIITSTIRRPCHPRRKWRRPWWTFLGFPIVVASLRVLLVCWTQPHTSRWPVTFTTTTTTTSMLAFAWTITSKRTMWSMRSCKNGQRRTTTSKSSFFTLSSSSSSSSSSSTRTLQENYTDQLVQVSPPLPIPRTKRGLGSKTIRTRTNVVPPLPITPTITTATVSTPPASTTATTTTTTNNAATAAPNPAMIDSSARIPVVLTISGNKTIQFQQPQRQGRRRRRPRQEDQQQQQQPLGTSLPPMQRERYGKGESGVIKVSSEYSQNIKQKEKKRMIVTTRTRTTMTTKRNETKQNGKRGGKMLHWDDMTTRLQLYFEKHGHTMVMKKEDPVLFKWMATIRANYRHQIQAGPALVGSSSLSSPAATATAHTSASILQTPLSTSRVSSEPITTTIAVSSSESSQTLAVTMATNTSSSSSTPPMKRRRPELSQVKLAQLAKVQFPWHWQQTLWQRRYRQLVTFQKRNGHCRVPANCREFPGLGIWVRNQRREYRKLLQTAFVRREEESQQPSDGSRLVQSPTFSMNPQDDGSTMNPNKMNATWSSCEHETIEPHLWSLSTVRSTLTRDRYEQLVTIGFEWHKSHTDAWEERYQELIEYFNLHGHSNVPEDYPPNKALGQWCMNQRTAYKQRISLAHNLPAAYGNNGTTPGPISSSIPSSSVLFSYATAALTPERIEKLEAIKFRWRYRDSIWYQRLERLKSYYSQHGHVQIATDDLSNSDLRIWLIWQRYWYNYYQNDAGRENGSKGVGRLSPERIRALESSIPNFSWTARTSSTSSPKTEDWAKLFHAMREKGIRPDARPKQHWFEGINPFTIQVKERWTEQDLLELWNQHGDDDDDDDDDVRMDGDVDEEYFFRMNRS